MVSIRTQVQTFCLLWKMDYTVFNQQGSTSPAAATQVLLSTIQLVDLHLGMLIYSLLTKQTSIPHLTVIYQSAIMDLVLQTQVLLAQEILRFKIMKFFLLKIQHEIFSGSVFRIYFQIKIEIHY